MVSPASNGAQDSKQRNNSLLHKGGPAIDTGKTKKRHAEQPERTSNECTYAIRTCASKIKDENFVESRVMAEDASNNLIAHRYTEKNSRKCSRKDSRYVVEWRGHWARHRDDSLSNPGWETDLFRLVTR